MSSAQHDPPRNDLADAARRAAVCALVLLGIGVVALGIWKLRLVVALVFLGFVLAAAMRPGIEALARRRVPRGVGVAIHYLALVGLIALFAWLVVPRALGQVEAALGVSSVPTSAATCPTRPTTRPAPSTRSSSRCRSVCSDLPSASKLVRPGLEIGRKAFEILIGVFFVFATAAYWIFERDRTIGFVCSLLPRPKRKLVRDTWILIDLKLGAFVRGQLSSSPSSGSCCRWPSGRSGSPTGSCSALSPASSRSSR